MLQSRSVNPLIASEEPLCAWVGMLAGAAGSYLSAREANRGASGGGTVDLTTTNNPWGPSAPYRQFMMDAGGNALGMPRQTGPNGQPMAGTYRPAGLADSPYYTPGGTFQPGGGAVAGAATPGGPRPRGGGGGGRGVPADGFQGQSDLTGGILGSLGARAQAGHPLYDPANQFTQDLLEGGQPNQYFDPTFDRFSDLENDPYLQMYMDRMFAGDLPGAGGGGGGGWGGTQMGGGGGGGGVGAGELTGAAGSIRDIVGGKYLDEGNPYRQRVQDASTRDIQRAFQEGVIPGINSEFAGSGMFGSSMYTDALGKAGGEYATSLADSIGGLNYADYNSRMEDVMTALGYGTSYDTAALDRAERSSSAAGAAGASRYNADLQAQLARSGLLLDAIQGHGALRQAGASGMGGLADMYGSGQLAALGMVPELSGLDIRDMGTAADLSISSDRAMNEFRADRGRERVGMAGINSSNRNANNALAWQREQFYDPLMRLGMFGDLVNSASGPYGYQTEIGTDRRSQSPSRVSPFGQAISGGMAGWYAGRDMQGNYGSAPPSNGMYSMGTRS